MEYTHLRAVLTELTLNYEYVHVLYTWGRGHHFLLSQDYNSSSPPKLEATPGDLIKATKGITLSSAKTVSAGNSCKQLEVAAAANLSRNSVSELLQTAKAVSVKAESEEQKER